jgi:hypothetical protein
MHFSILWNQSSNQLFHILSGVWARSSSHALRMSSLLDNSSNVLLCDRRGWASWPRSILQTEISSPKLPIPPEYGRMMGTVISHHSCHFLQTLINTQTTCKFVTQDCPVFHFWPRWHCKQHPEVILLAAVQVWTCLSMLQLVTIYDYQFRHIAKPS